MSDLLLYIRDLCLRRRGPQDMPYSLRLLLIFIGAELTIDMLVANVLGYTENSLSRFLLITSFKLIALNIILTLRDLRARYVQTASALMACSVVFTLMLFPLQLAMSGFTPNTAPQDVTPLQMLAMWLTLAIVIWKVRVDANILRQALNAPAFAAYLLAILAVVIEGVF